MHSPSLTFGTFSTLIVISLFFLISCGTTSRLLQKDNYSTFPQLKISEATSFERKIKSINITPSHFVAISESIYPNTNNYTLKVNTFKKKFIKEFNLTVDYYYAINDRLVKIILYQWDKSSDNKSNKFQDEKTKSAMFDRFQNKFNQLSDSLTKHLGRPIHTNIDQKNEANETFRDDVRWLGQDGINAYLFMFGNNKNRYRQIRLAIYKD
ncbi:MAG: hypothetical protein HZB42_04100 [Sphingobacteriales bacterium]|nr:hypothetical protein [Sphingobacteriales bacterium]